AARRTSPRGRCSGRLRGRADSRGRARDEGGDLLLQLLQASENLGMARGVAGAVRALEVGVAVGVERRGLDFRQRLEAALVRPRRQLADVDVQSGHPVGLQAALVNEADLARSLTPERPGGP